MSKQQQTNIEINRLLSSSSSHEINNNTVQINNYLTDTKQPRGMSPTPCDPDCTARLVPESKHKRCDRTNIISNKLMTTLLWVTGCNLKRSNTIIEQCSWWNVPTHKHNSSQSQLTFVIHTQLNKEFKSHFPLTNERQTKHLRTTSQIINSKNETNCQTQTNLKCII
jgi:hypothetical protein